MDGYYPIAWGGILGMAWLYAAHVHAGQHTEIWAMIFSELDRQQVLELSLIHISEPTNS